MMLLFKGLIKLLSGVILMGALLFLPAGTVNYPGAWRMIMLMSASMVILGTSLFAFAPKLLEKRLNSKEEEPQQKVVILLSALMFIGCFVLCGLDYRFGWTKIPKLISVIGCAVFVLTYLGFAELLRENEYLSRTVEIQEDQQVVSTGLYGIVRHPMYFMITFMFLSMPIIIGSIAGLIPFAGWPVIIAGRIGNEEKVLEEGLAGYKEYEQKVRYRMIPFIW